MIELEERIPSTSATGAHSKKTSAARAAIPFTYEGGANAAGSHSQTSSSHAAGGAGGAGGEESASDEEEDAVLLDVGALAGRAAFTFTSSFSHRPSPSFDCGALSLSYYLLFNSRTRTAHRRGRRPRRAVRRAAAGSQRVRARVRHAGRRLRDVCHADVLLRFVRSASIMITCYPLDLIAPDAVGAQ